MSAKSACATGDAVQLGMQAGGNMISVTKRILIGATLLALVVILVPAAAKAQSYANFEGSQTNPIRLSADGTRLFAVNTANASLSVFNVTQPSNPILMAQIPVGLGPVSVNPLSDDVAWVVNQVSNSISVVSVSKGIVTGTIYLKVPLSGGTGTSGGEPMDVVFSGSAAYVSISRANQIAVIDTTTQTLVATIPLFGDSPRAMAVSPDGSTVYAAFALAGNATTLIPNTAAPTPCGTVAQGRTPCVPAMNPNLPPAPQVGLIVAANNPTWYPSFIKYTMPDNGVAAIKTGATPTVSYYSGVGTINLGLAVSPVTGDVFVANTDALNLTLFENNLCGHFVNNRITHIQVANGTVTPYDLNPKVTYGCAPNPADLSIALAQPANVVFDPSGNFMYVAAFGTDRVAKVSTNGTVLGFVEVSLPSGSGSNVDPANKRGPRGLALNATANVLYALNRISNTISIIPTSLTGVSNEIVVGTDPTPSTVKAGRGFLYDAKLSGTGTGACAGCHIDGEMDHLAWNLGDPTADMTSFVQDGQTFLYHPMKGPMTTQTLRGLANLAPYHWRGDKPDFAAFNAAFVSLMGGSQISDADMATYTTYINSVLYLPNPNQNLDRSLPTSMSGGDPVTGLLDFLTVTGTEPGPSTCQSCHATDPGPGTNLLIRPAADTQAQQPLKVPQLRAIYQKELFDREATTTIDGFGLVHDGAKSDITAFLQDTAFSGYTQTEKNDIAAYSLCFDTGTAPAVGYTRTLTAANVASSPAQSDWTTLQSQASAGNIDLIGRGTLKGVVHGLLYQTSSNNYISDTGALYTQSQLQALVVAGDTLSLMGVYPGTGSAQ
jgi:YVTN family beta-propeller protein